MTKIIIDDSWIFERFRVITKFCENPEDLTPSEKKRLKELGLEVE